MAVTRTRRNGMPPPRRGGPEVSEMQRARMLRSAVQIVSEQGYPRMSVARVTARARVSRRTFYDFFTDREDCYLTVFEDSLAQASRALTEAYAAAPGSDWAAKVRAALGALLVFLEEQPEIAALLLVDALRAGPAVLRRRAQTLEQIGAALDHAGACAKGAGRRPAPLTGEGVVGAVFSVLHARVLAERPEPLSELLGPLTSMVVLPYLGAGAAQREVRRSAPPSPLSSHPAAPKRSGGSARSPRRGGDPLAGLPMRLTYRTLRTLAAIGELPGASNRQVADAAGIVDQGQVSKLLGRLERLGLIVNDGAGQPHGERNAWQLTTLGEELRGAIVKPGDLESNIKGGAMAASVSPSASEEGTTCR